MEKIKLTLENLYENKDILIALCEYEDSSNFVTENLKTAKSKEDFIKILHNSFSWIYENICKFGMDYKWVLNFSNGLAKARKNSYWGMINEFGVEIIKPKYKDIIKFYEFGGFILIDNNEKYGLINNIGEIVVDCIYDTICGYSEGLIRVNKGKKCGFIDVNGNEVIECIFDECNLFKSGLAIVKFNGEWGIIDNRGKVIIDYGKYKYIRYICNGLVVIVLDTGYGVIDRYGKEIIKCGYDNIYIDDDMIRVEVEDKYGIRGIDGKVITGLIYNYISPFYKNGYAEIKKDYKCGIIDKEGREIVPCKYSYIGGKYGDYISVCNKNNLWGFINIKDGRVIECIFNTIHNFNDNLILVDYNSKLGLLDMDMNIVASCKFDKIIPYGDNILFMDKKTGVVKLTKV